MVQLLNLVVHNLAAPALHNSGFAVSATASFVEVSNVLFLLYDGVKIILQF